MQIDERLSTLRDLGFRGEAIAELRKYLTELLQANTEMNLISRRMTPEELIDNHVIDCLLPLSHFPKGDKVVADFGSGGGLPAVLYALQFPETEFQLFEKSPKKRSFLESCRSFAPNLVVRAEIPSTFDKIDLVTARAFKPIDVILEMSRSYYQKGGRYFLLKGRREKIDEELALARKKTKSLEARVLQLKSPVVENERNLVLIP